MSPHLSWSVGPSDLWPVLKGQLLEAEMRQNQLQMLVLFLPVSPFLYYTSTYNKTVTHWKWKTVKNVQVFDQKFSLHTKPHY